jgi:hypothetical protein
MYLKKCSLREAYALRESAMAVDHLVTSML